MADQRKYALLSSDGQALSRLQKSRFNVSRGGVISKLPGIEMTDLEIEAINYLIMEWDYGYEDMFRTEVEK